MAESFKPITRKLNEVKESTKTLEVFTKTDSENENHQELVPVESDSDVSDKKNDNIKPLPNIPTPSDAMRETMGSLLKSHKPLRINTG